MSIYSPCGEFDIFGARTKFDMLAFGKLDMLPAATRLKWRKE